MAHVFGDNKEQEPTEEECEAALDKQDRIELLREYFQSAYNGLLASGKWRAEEHRDLVTRAWDLAEMMMVED